MSRLIDIAFSAAIVLGIVVVVACLIMWFREDHHPPQYFRECIRAYLPGQGEVWKCRQKLR